MPLPNYKLRGPMLPSERGIRAYFAPLARGAETPAVFDPAVQAMFPLESPPAPWLDLGFIANFKRTSSTAFTPVRGGTKNAAAALARKDVSASVEFDFRNWGKLQMALAGGSQHMNVLATDNTATPSASGGYEPVAAVPLITGSNASEVVIDPIAALAFNIGDLLVIDIDYIGQTGYVGSGLAGAYVRNASYVRSDVNYIRRVTFNVARIADRTVTTFFLAQPLLGGDPLPGAALQKITGFVDREGGSFFQEWSALFVIPEEAGGRICFHYPRLQPVAPAAETAFKIDAALEGIGLHCALAALPATDLNDNEQVLCYRSYFPAANAALY
jgi:hypothetical protein